MDILELIKDFAGYGIFAVLFIWQNNYIMTTTQKREDEAKKESKEREDKLFVQLDRYNDQLTENTKALLLLQNEITDIKQKI